MKPTTVNTHAPEPAPNPAMFDPGETVYQAANPLEFLLPFLFRPSHHVSGAVGYTGDPAVRGWDRYDVLAANEAMFGHRGNLSADAQHLLNSMINRRDTDYSQFFTALQNQLEYSRNEQDRAAARESQARATREGLTGLDKWYEGYKPTLQRDINYWGGILGEDAAGNKVGPMNLRGDEGFAGALTSEESAINSAVRAAQKSASQGMSARGVAGSGKMQDIARKSYIEGAMQKDRLNTDFAAQARGNRSGAEAALSDLERDYGLGKSQIEGGNFNALTGLASYQNPYRNAAFGDFRGTSTDMRGMNIGNDRANMALALQAILGFGEMANNSMSSIMGMFGGKGK